MSLIRWKLSCIVCLPFFPSRNISENRSVDNELIRTLQWITNVWQRYNECLQKLSLQDALLGPALFFDCPMEREAIFEYGNPFLRTIRVTDTFLSVVGYK